MPGHAPGGPTQSEQQRRRRSTRLSELVQRASHGWRVAELMVTPGENVGPDTLLMRLEQPETPKLGIYLPPRWRIDQLPLKVRFQPFGP